MTISISWQRRLKNTDEIIFASDSRLSAGYRWDCAQKIFPIMGPNFCISFAGCADFAYPCLSQFQLHVRNYKKFNDGSSSIFDIFSGFLGICNQLLEIVSDDTIAQFKDTRFLFSGYDFQTGRSFQKIVLFNKSIRKFSERRFGGLRHNGRIFSVGFIGDKRDEYMREFLNALREDDSNLNYQPLIALNKIIESQDRFSPIGGSIQVVKVYKHRNFLPYAINNNGRHYLFGRPLMSHERTLYPIANLSQIGTPDFVSYPMAPQEATT